jgi:serine/threonine-protein kinase
VAGSSDTVVEAPRGERDFATAAWIGKDLDGRYRLTEVLGSGAFAVVFRARHLALGRDVAVKVLLPETATVDRSLLARFTREADVLARMSHPNIVAATDSGVWEGKPYLVMELVEGKNLRDLLDEGPVPLSHTLSIVRQMLRALSYAHAKGVLHRDLKPGNVALFWPDENDDEPLAKVLDFGLAKIMESEGLANSAITAEGTACGTPGYVSPEVLSGSQADARSDLFAIGVMLWEMLVGRRPFAGRSRGEELRLTITAPAPSLVEEVPDLPCVAELDAILQLALARRPAERFADAGSMLAALEQIDPTRTTGQRAAPKVARPSEQKKTNWREIRVPLPIVMALVAVPTALALVLVVVLLIVLSAGGA